MCIGVKCLDIKSLENDENMPVCDLSELQQCLVVKALTNAISYINVEHS
jgi:hypothetical protein